MRVPDHVDPIRVRWYPVESVVPGSYELTDYSSSNWDLDPKSYDPDLGEQSTTRDPWRDWRYCLAPPFDPSVLEGLYAWFREVPYPEDTNPRDLWPDKTGNGFDLIQPTAGMQPSWAMEGSANNIYDGMLFSPGMQMDFGIGPQLGTDWTALIVYQRTPLSSVGSIDLFSTTTAGGVTLRDNLASSVDDKGVDIKATGSIKGSVDFQWTFDRPLAIVASRNDRSFKLWIGGKLKVSTPLNGQGTVIGSLGLSVGVSGDNPFGVSRYISEIALWNRTLSKWEAGSINEYARLRYPAAFD